MKILDVIQWDDPEASVNDIVVYKHEAENFNTSSYLIVHESQEAFLVQNGNIIGPFPAGRHQLSTERVPLLTKFTDKLITGGATPFNCEVYFVNKVFLQDLRWGTPNPIVMEDPVEGVNIHVGANGLFGAHIDAAKEFLVKVVGTRARFSKTELADYLRGKIIERVTDLLGKTMCNQRVGILSVSAHFQSLSDEIKAQMTPFFADFGIALDNFSFNTIKAPDEDLRAINDMKIEARRMDMESAAMARKRAREGYSYQQERGYDVMGTAAANEGTSGTFMNAGMGLGMGVGMGGVFGAGMNNIMQEGFAGMQQPVQPQQPQAPSATCPECNAPVAAGAKFCPSCGKKLGNFCPDCGAELAPNAKFCGNCGKKLTSNCPKCGAEVAPGTKFCGNCGEKLG